jgi:hypothetical protein
MNRWDTGSCCHNFWLLLVFHLVYTPGPLSKVLAQFDKQDHIWQSWQSPQLFGQYYWHDTNTILQAFVDNTISGCCITSTLPTYIKPATTISFYFS